MAQTKRIEVLVDPEELTAIEQLAAQRGLSVSDLLRALVRREGQLGRPTSPTPRALAAARFLALAEGPLPDWADLKQELQSRHDPCVS